MPELPEVETTMRGILPHIHEQVIKRVTFRQTKLRFPIPAHLKKTLVDLRITHLSRRGKYLLLHTFKGALIIHLGMSGNLRIVTQGIAPKKHDHVDIEFANKKILRFNDTRRFGAVLWAEGDGLNHVLLKNLGPEPLEDFFCGNYLWERAQKKNVSIKAFLMNNAVVVGIGNIYATEALFTSKIHPLSAVKNISLATFDHLVLTIKALLRHAIQQGGTTLKDFVNSDGKPGYFANHLNVYGRAGLACFNCKTTLISLRIGQRSTVFCSNCQKEQFF